MSGSMFCKCGDTADWHLHGRCMRPTCGCLGWTGPGETSESDTTVCKRGSVAELDTATQAVLDAAEEVERWCPGQVAMTRPDAAIRGLGDAVRAHRALLNSSRELQLGIILRREMVRHDVDDNTIESIIEAVTPQLLEHMGELS